MDYHKILNVGTDRFEQTMLTGIGAIWSGSSHFAIHVTSLIRKPNLVIGNTVRFFYVNDSTVSTCILQVSQSLEFD